ncbi:DUF2157 domain-containing protein [Sphingobacterium bovistauri]|uniref:DUF2157 domain-containing protein n=1 Tax=Sphingobacterium bovistauri TaxID=2781959 RepID=A0ABS7Z2N3_9SPHI|nr:DUF2157 domain-containing protein [Sphingobacterium bovistauri]MCA5004429.1 DUF2157 domain-containing protein [Sphingobacterium bovistauri]
MKKLDLSRQDKETVEEALAFWKASGQLDESTVEELRSTIDERSFEWRVLARYAFWVALASLIFSVVSLFSDNTLEKFVQQFYDAPNIVYCIFFAGLAAVFYYLGFRNKKLYPEKTFSNETLMLAGAFSTAACIGFLGQILDRDNHFFTILFFISILIYGVLSIKLQSKLIWVFTLIALGIWFATETAYHSEWGWKFWGMNYPLRFTIFGIILTACAVFVQPKFSPLKSFKSTSVIIGLLYTMIALWILSIFGNYSDFEAWSRIRQIEIFYWGLIAIALSLGLAIYGLKRKDNVIRDIGFVFFLINLYTRFVEYLWDNINRTIFFLILAVSFWLVGRWSEKVWKKQSSSD